MRKSLTLLAVAAIAVGMLAAGCGGDDDETTTAAPSKQEFIKQADAICVKGDKELDQAGRETFGKGQPSKQEIEQFATDTLVPNIQGQIDGVRALTPPELLADEENPVLRPDLGLTRRLLAEAAQIGRFTLEQNQAGGSKLPESDREDMEVFLARIRQLLPVLGSDILAPIAQPAASAQPGGVLVCRTKGAEALGQRTANGFVVFHGSTAVLEERPSAESYPYVLVQRKKLTADGTLIEKDGFLVFTKDAEFSSPSAAAVVIHGGSANGLTAWKTKDGKSLKQLDEQA